MSRNIGQSGDAVDLANLRQRVATLEQLMRGVPALAANTAGLDALWASRVGTMEPLMHSTVPAGAVLANGQSVSRTLFPKLFAKLGTYYGSGDGVTTFGVPDMRGRTFAGMDAMSSPLGNALRIGAGYTNGVPNGNRDTLGAVGGLEYHQLGPTESGMPGFTVNSGTGVESIGYLRHIVINTPGAAANYGNPHVAHTSPANSGYYDYGGGTAHGMAHYHQSTVGAMTAANAHNNVQPTMLGYWIIWTGERP